MGKRLLSFALLGALCALLCPVTVARAVSTSAQAAILMDADTGRVLYAQNETQERSVASITKLVTALTAVELCPDPAHELVRVDPAAAGVEGSSMYLAAGEELTLEDLLYGLLLRSGNDAAVAIAIHCAGDTAAFAQKMNETAAALGMTHSHFENPSGLESEGHYSCAYDMALAGRAVLAHPLLAQIVATKSITRGSRVLENHNKLLRLYEGCIGLKTGFTKKAGRTLVSAAKRGGTTLIAVTLNDGDDWRDHAALLDYGFSNYHSFLLARSGKGMGLIRVEGSLLPAVAVVTAGDARACLSAGEQPTARLELPDCLTAPVETGDRVGTLTFYLEGKEIGRTDLVAATSAPDHTWRLRG